MKIINSTFSRNIAIFDQSIIDLFLSKITGVPDVVQLNPENGGILYFQGANLYINQSFFSENTGFKGGAIFISEYAYDITQNIIISESYFKANRGNTGGVIDFPLTLVSLNAVMIFCIFNGNIAKSIEFI